MILRFVALSSTGFTELYVDGHGAIKFAGPAPANIIVLDGISWPTRPVELPPINRTDCFLVIPPDRYNGSMCGPGLLHHYTTPESVVKILESGSLLLSPYTRANDDYERASRWFNIYCADESGHPGLAMEAQQGLGPNASVVLGIRQLLQ